MTLKTSWEWGEWYEEEIKWIMRSVVMWCCWEVDEVLWSVLCRKSQHILFLSLGFGFHCEREDVAFLLKKNGKEKVGVIVFFGIGFYMVKYEEYEVSVCMKMKIKRWIYVSVYEKKKNEK